MLIDILIDVHRDEHITRKHTEKKNGKILDLEEKALPL